MKNTSSVATIEVSSVSCVDCSVTVVCPAVDVASVGDSLVAAVTCSVVMSRRSVRSTACEVCVVDCSPLFDAETAADSLCVGEDPESQGGAPDVVSRANASVSAATVPSTDVLSEIDSDAP